MADIIPRASAIDPAALRDALNYDQDSGTFTWRIWVSPSARPGSSAGTRDRKGHVRIKFGQQRIAAHRLAWLFVTGSWPDGQIDHVNRDRGDNRFCNLRLATNSQNQANCWRSSSNSSGFKGVSWSKKDRKWRAQIKVGGAYRFLGNFDTPEQASAAYAAVAIEHFGEFARLTEAGAQQSSF